MYSALRCMRFSHINHFCTVFELGRCLFHKHLICYKIRFKVLIDYNFEKQQGIPSRNKSREAMSIPLLVPQLSLKARRLTIIQPPASTLNFDHLL
jgi:hypothetical protein